MNELLIIIKKEHLCQLSTFKGILHPHNHSYISYSPFTNFHSSTQLIYWPGVLLSLAHTLLFFSGISMESISRVQMYTLAQAHYSSYRRGLVTIPPKHGSAEHQLNKWDLDCIPRVVWEFVNGSFHIEMLLFNAAPIYCNSSSIFSVFRFFVYWGGMQEKQDFHHKYNVTLEWVIDIQKIILEWSIPLKVQFCCFFAVIGQLLFLELVEILPIYPPVQSESLYSHQHKLKKVNTLQLSEDEHVDDKPLSNQGLLISIYWKLIGFRLMTMQPLAGNC